jgi:hypothetical protein
LAHPSNQAGLSTRTGSRGRWHNKAPCLLPEWPERLAKSRLPSLRSRRALPMLPSSCLFIWSTSSGGSIVCRSHVAIRMFWSSRRMGSLMSTNQVPRSAVLVVRACSRARPSSGGSRDPITRPGPPEHEESCQEEEYTETLDQSSPVNLPLETVYCNLAWCLWRLCD